jgi:hypothetical protein
MELREQRLEQCLTQLLDCTELNLDELEEETQAAIRQAQLVIDSQSDAPHVEELANTMLYIGEQVELVSLTVQSLRSDMDGLMKAVRPQNVLKALWDRG